jgi:hypothetical protein
MPRKGQEKPTVSLEMRLAASGPGGRLDVPRAFGRLRSGYLANTIRRAFRDG